MLHYGLDNIYTYVSWYFFDQVDCGHLMGFLQYSQEYLVCICLLIHMSHMPNSERRLDLTAEECEGYSVICVTVCQRSEIIKLTVTIWHSKHL